MELESATTGSTFCDGSIVAISMQENRANMHSEPFIVFDFICWTCLSSLLWPPLHGNEGFQYLLLILEKVKKFGHKFLNRLIRFLPNPLKALAHLQYLFLL